MRVALEASSLAIARPAGIGRYVVQLALALQRLAGIEPQLWYRLSRIRQRGDWWRPEGLPARAWQGGWWPPRYGVDLLHGTDARLPPSRGLPTVATLHDLTVLRDHDPMLARAGFRDRKRNLYRTMLNRADRIIAVSETTARDAVEFLGADRDRLRVIHHGVEERFRPLPPDEVNAVLARRDLEPGYLLYVGTVSQRKNTERLIRAFAASPAANDRTLVLAGNLYHRSEATLKTIHRLGLDDRVHCLDFVPDEDLPALYNGAAALALPSLYEGFGLPVLEALACGIPVLCGREGAATEVAGDLAVAVDPESDDDVAAGIDRVLLEPPGDRETRLARAGAFTWEATARQTVQVYRELLE